MGRSPKRRNDHRDIRRELVLSVTVPFRDRGAHVPSHARVLDGWWRDRAMAPRISSS